MGTIASDLSLYYPAAGSRRAFSPFCAGILGALGYNDDWSEKDDEFIDSLHY